MSSRFFHPCDINLMCKIINFITLSNCPVFRAQHKERLQIDGIPNLRAEMLVVAFILVKYVFSLLPSSQRFYVSDYAMKEGILAEMMTTSA